MQERQNKPDKLLRAIETLICKETPLVSNLANLSKIIYDNFPNTCWCGFYICSNEEDSMYLGPFQGPIACTKIPFNKGVCGAAVTQRKSMLVPDVHKFKDHIACYNLTNSEVVVPIIKNDHVYGVIDLDSTEFDNYTEVDVLRLEKIANIVSQLF